jgi:hypothetical protein
MQVIVQTSKTSPSPDTMTIPYQSSSLRVLTNSLAWPAYSEQKKTEHMLHSSYKKSVVSITDSIWFFNWENYLQITAHASPMNEAGCWNISVRTLTTSGLALNFRSPQDNNFQAHTTNAGIENRMKTAG